MENWKPAAGFEACYSVSDQGRCARTATYGSNPRPVWKICAIRIKYDGYVQFHLSKDGKAVDVHAHRLVWQSFKGPIPPDREINHKNSKRDDNRLRNLELLTRSQNAAYAFSHNGRPSPTGSPTLKEEDIPKIFELHAAGFPQHRIGALFGVGQMAISRVLRGKSWGRIRKDV